MIQQVEVLYTSSWINCLNCKVLYIKPFKRGCIPFQLPSLWRVPKITWGLTCWFWTTKRRKNRPSSRSLSPLSTYARHSVSRSCRWRTCTHPRSRSIKFLCSSGPGIWVKKNDLISMFNNLQCCQILPGIFTCLNLAKAKYKRIWEIF